jgi:hypothetical protein
MVSSLPFVKATGRVSLAGTGGHWRFSPIAQDSTILLRGRMYSTTSTRPTFVLVHTQVNEKSRSPRLDLLLGEKRLQPHIHDTRIHVWHERTLTIFHVFYKNHLYLKKNQSVRRLSRRTCVWRGDILVMRGGKRADFVNTRPGDARLADFAIRR